MIYLAPLLIVGAASYFAARRHRLVGARGRRGVCGWLVLAYGYQLDYPYFEAPGYGIAAMANRAFALGPADDPRWARRRCSSSRCSSVALPLVRRPLGSRGRALLGFAALGVAVWALAGEITSARGSQRRREAARGATCRSRSTGSTS